MKPIDFRNVKFAELQARLHGQRLAALDAYRTHGPGTTREVSIRSGMDLLTLRPRTTELLQLGFVIVVEGTEHANEGIYRALTDAEAEAMLLHKQAEPIQCQPELPPRPAAELRDTKDQPLFAHQ